MNETNVCRVDDDTYKGIEHWKRTCRVDNVGYTTIDRLSIGEVWAFAPKKNIK